MSEQNIILLVWVAGWIVIPSLYFLIGGLMGKTVDDLWPDNDAFYIIGVVFWPVVPFGCAIFFIIWCLIMAVTYPARRNQKIKDRKEAVEKKLESLQWRRGVVTGDELEMLGKLNWQQAEQYLKQKGLL